jgi:hypothetical protein
MMHAKSTVMRCIFLLKIPTKPLMVLFDIRSNVRDIAGHCVSVASTWEYVVVLKSANSSGNSLFFGASILTANGPSTSSEQNEKTGEVSFVLFQHRESWSNFKHVIRTYLA